MIRTPRDRSVVAPIPPYPLRHSMDDLERYRIQKYRSKQLPYPTESVCPECLLTDGTIRVVNATVSEKNGAILLYKTCPRHGAFQDVYWSDADMFLRSMNYWYHTVGLDNPRTEHTNGCPYDCGLCPDHLAHTALGIIDVTTKCDLHCPVCFADAAAPGIVYEPAPADVLNMLTTLRENQPVPCPAVQFAGGEPTLSKYLPTYVRWAKHLGFDHIMVATNGLRISQNREYVRTLRQAGMNTLYLQFDGMSRQSNVATRGLDLRQIKNRVLEHCRAASLEGVILVPTIIKGVNDDQLGDMIRFAVLNRDIVRCINFQPVSITGRINYARRQLMRITMPEAIQKIAEQTCGRITQHDWYPVASMMAVGRALGLMKGIPTVELHAHFACGMATFIVIDKDGSYVPITQIVDLEKILQTLEDICNLYADQKSFKGPRAIWKLLGLLRHIQTKSCLDQILAAFLKKGTYASLAKFMHNVIMLGMMHFQDPFNMDLERIRHCAIHYATPYGRLIPFCAYNTFHREATEMNYIRSSTCYAEREQQAIENI